MKRKKNISIYKKELERAWNLYKENKIDLAQIEVTRIIENYPEEADSTYLLGHIYRSQRFFAKAVEQFLNALKLDTNEELSGYIYYWLGEIYKYEPWDNIDDFQYDENKSSDYYSLARTSKNFPPEAIIHDIYSLNAQEKVERLEEGIAAFPLMSDFYIRLAQHYSQLNLRKLQYESYERALQKEIISSSLFYNLGHYHYDKKEYNSALNYFEKALDNNSNNSQRNFGIYYWIGKSYERLSNLEKALEFYFKAYHHSEGDSDCMYGFLGLTNVFLIQGDLDRFKDLILDFNIKDDYFNPYAFDGPFRLANYVYDSISFVDLEETYKQISKVRPESNNDTFNGKISSICCFLAILLSKYSAQYKHIRNARKYLMASHYNFLEEMHANVLENLINNYNNTKGQQDKTYKYVTSDLGDFYGFKNKIFEPVQRLISNLFDSKAYAKIITLCEFYNTSELAESNILFELGFSFIEEGEVRKGKKTYELYLKSEGDSVAVLNNLGNIYDKEGNYKQAIELYNRGLAIDPEHKKLQNNLKATLQRNKDSEDRAQKEKSLYNEYSESISLLKKENDYVLDKLTRFIEHLKKDENYLNDRIPIAKYKFQTYLGVDKQRAESLCTQWLAKGYIKDSGERDGHNVVIYILNPLIQNELSRLNKFKIPQKWIDSFINISIDNLEQLGYYEIIPKINKTNKKYKSLLERDFNELTYNYLLGHEKATIVLSGSLVELVLTFYCERKRIMSISVKDSKGIYKNKKLYDCVLSDLIDYVEQNKTFGADFVHLSNLSRIYRNFIHPGKELKDNLDKTKANICYVSTIEILKRII